MDRLRLSDRTSNSGQGASFTAQTIRHPEYCSTKLVTVTNSRSEPRLDSLGNKHSEMGRFPRQSFERKPNMRVRQLPVMAALVGAVTIALSIGQFLSAQQPVTLTVRADQPGVKIDPMFYGLMTEEINFSYDGGLYAELIRNRTFRDNAQNPVNWSVAKYGGGEGSIALENNPVPSTALTTALKLDATYISGGQRVGVANEGYWGIPVKPDTTYRASFYAKASSEFQRTADRGDRKQRWARPLSPRPRSRRSRRSGRNTQPR